LLALFSLPACDMIAGSTDERTSTVSTANVIWIDAATQTAAPPPFWSASVGTGTASLTLRGDLQFHYKIGNREAGFQRVRGHGVLNDDMNIYKGPGSYDWTSFDRYLTAIAAAGMRPIMEMDFMPSALALHGDKHDIYNDAGAYQSFIAAVARHCVDRFGAADVAQWYWEIWNEPDFVGFWRGRNAGADTNSRMNDYEALYDNAAAAITSVIPNALVGGPAATNPRPLAGFLEHCRRVGAPLTFVSSHHYPGGDGSGGWADASQLVTDNESRLGAIAQAGYAPARVMSFASEWSSSYSGQGGGTGDTVVSMDNHWNVGFILKAVKLLSDQSNGAEPPLGMFSYWALSDVFDESNGPSGSYILGRNGGQLPFGSVFGLITAQGVRKAAFNAFKLLHYLGPVRLQSGGGGSRDGVDAMATMSPSGDAIQILVYDQYRRLDTSGTDTATVNLYNVPAALVGKQVFVTRFIVDETHSNPCDVWRNLGKPPAPTEADWRAIRAAQHLYALPVETTTLGSSFTASFAINRQSATLLVLSLERPLMGRDAFMPIEGEDYDGQAGALKLDCDDADLGQMAAITGGGSVFYDVVDFSDRGIDAVRLRARVATATSVELHLDAPDGPLLGSCPLSATARRWTTSPCPLAHATGVHTLYLNIAGTANLNWLQFE
jgi:xylan 1,4-beta-xylosidase